MLKNGRFGATVITGRDEGGRTCINGLPVVPASVRMLGRFQFLKELNHELLNKYIEFIRCSLAPNSAIIISEFHDESLEDVLGTNSNVNTNNITWQISSAMAFLHAKGLSVGLLRPKTVLFVNGSDRQKIRLSLYGLSYMTNDGTELVDGLDLEHGIAPEQLLSTDCLATFRSDIWSLGILLLELVTNVSLTKMWSINQYLAVVENALKSKSDNMYEYISNAVRNSNDSYQTPTDEDLVIIRGCLFTFPSKRHKISEILEILKSDPSFKNDAQRDKFESISEMKERIEKTGDDWKLHELDMELAFYLWKLCGSTPESILIRNGIIKLQFPIDTLPNLIIEDFRLFGNEEGRLFRVKFQTFRLPFENLRKKLSSLDDNHFLHSVELDGLPPNDSSDLSLVVKEKDVSYQLSRSLIVKHLLAGRFHHNLLSKAVDQDIPPLLRGPVWADLLGVKRSDTLTFYDFNTLEVHVSDRQLDVDIPRCHQYEELMTSPAAHANLRKLLKSWLLSHPQYVYWQGCDSLAAPFLLLNFNDLPTALASLTSFIHKYLFNFFLKDNSAVIQEYLAVFNHLLAYVDASLYTKLRDLDFYPELFAIPWFLTCFAHVLPLHKLFHVWDVLLLKDSSFPLFIVVWSLCSSFVSYTGLSILKQLRSRLIDGSFNDAILLFSDLPDLSIEKVISESLIFYDRVPPSCAKRINSNQAVCETNEEPAGLPCSLSPMSFIELKQWNCPRMSREEFVWRITRQLVLVIDIRSAQEFNRGSIIMSLSYPNPSDSSFLNIAEAMKAAQRNYHPICVVGGKDVECTRKFSSLLVHHCIDGVCVLDGGFDAVRNDRSIIGLS